MKALFVALLASVAASAMAQYADNPAPSQRTREEVRAAVLKARADGTLQQGGEYGQIPPAFHSQRTRAEVAGEVLQARANGTLQTGSEYSLVKPAFQSQRTRAEVIAEVLQARADGTLREGGEYSYSFMHRARRAPDTMRAEAGAPNQGAVQAQ